MSSLKAIASVTHVLQRILEESISDESIDTLGADVFIDPPDQVETTINENQNALNLYLYMVKENEGWKNQDLIERNSFGDRVSNPYLALDLYYMLSAYGSEAYNDELLLGYAMVALKDNAIVGRDFIANELAAEPMLADSGLSEQMEQLRIVPLSPNTEEVSKLWTMFGAKHRVSSYYKVSVALLRKEREVSVPLPVRERKLYVRPIIIPEIQDLMAGERADPDYTNTRIFLDGDDLIMKGIHLRGDVTRVVFDADESVTLTPDKSTEITLQLPASLRAGLHSVQIAHDLMLGEPEVPHRGVKSNLAAFVLSPLIESVSISGDDLDLTIAPAIEADKQVTVLLNEIDFDTTTRSANEYSLSDTTVAETTTITVSIANVTSGTYLVRLRVNNATSPLFHDFSGPSVVIP